MFLFRSALGDHCEDKSDFPARRRKMVTVGVILGKQFETYRRHWIRYTNRAHNLAYLDLDQ